MTIKIGDKVRTTYESDVEGVVTNILTGKNIEDHGFVEIQVTKVHKSSYLKVGDFEDYVHFGWNNSLEIIEEKNDSIQ